jgi:hypothetical protein
MAKSKWLSQRSSHAIKNSLNDIDTLTSRRQETSSRTSQFMLPQLSHRSKIDAQRFETVDTKDG